MDWPLRKLILIGILCLAPLLMLSSTTPFMDDWSIVLQPDVTNPSPDSPLAYWDRESGFVKAWPLSHSIYWFYRKLGADFAPLLFSINIALHLIGVVLIWKLFESLQTSIRSLTVALWTLSPATLFTVGQIIQLNTLLANVLFLAGLLFLQRSQNWRGAILPGVLMGFSLLAKPVWILGPLLGFLLPRSTSQSSMKTQGLGLRGGVALLAFLPFALWTAHMTWSGIRWNPYEAKAEARYMENNFETFSTQKIREGHTPVAPPKADDATPGDWTRKGTLAFANLGFYVSKSFWYSDSQYFYEKNLEIFHTLIGISILLLLALGIAVLRREARGSHLAFSFGLLVLGFLPVSGLAYVPYMKFSFVSHHWFYAAQPGLAFLMAVVILRVSDFLLGQRGLNVGNSALVIVVLFIFGLQSLVLAWRFSDRTEFLKSNTEAFPHSAITWRLLGEEQKRRGQFKEALQSLSRSAELAPYDFSVVQQINDLKPKATSDPTGTTDSK